MSTPPAPIKEDLQAVKGIPAPPPPQMTLMTHMLPPPPPMTHMSTPSVHQSTLWL